MAAALRLNLLLLMAVTFQMSLAASCLASEKTAASARESGEGVADLPPAEAPTCVKDETSRRKLVEMCTKECCRLLATGGAIFAVPVILGPSPLAVDEACDASPTGSLQSERIRLQV